MNKLIDILEEKVVPVAVKIGNNNYINAIKNAFMKLMPLSLIGAIFILINNVFLNFSEGSFFYQMGIRISEDSTKSISQFQSIGNAATNGTIGILSLMIPFMFAGEIAKKNKVDESATGLMAIAAFITLTPTAIAIPNLTETVTGISTSYLGGQNVISGMLIGLIVGEAYSFIVNRGWVIKMPDNVPPAVARSFSSLIPGFIILIVLGALSMVLANNHTNFHEIIIKFIATPLTNAGGIVGAVYIFFSGFLWFFGVHGALVLSALDSPVMGVMALQNIDIFQKYGSVDAAIKAGEHFNMWAKPMIDSYIFLGGTGATLGLIIAIFLASKRSDWRQVAKFGLPAGIFQINEPILFGIPVILNPVLFIPYILVQPILGIVTTIAYKIGFIPPVTNIAPWTMPVGLGAFFNTNGSISAMALAFINLGIATLIYFPFVVVANKIAEKEQQEANNQETVSL